MSDCLQYLAAGVQRHNLAARSPVYSAVSDSMAAAAASSVGTISPPSLSGMVFAVPVKADFAAKLSEGVFEAPEPPTGSFQVPDLEPALYLAVQSLIDFAHNAPTIEDIKYLTGLDALPVPDNSAPAPPLNYPQVPLEQLPQGPDELYTQPPTITLGEKPALPTLVPLEYTPSGLEPYDFTDLVRAADYTAPEMDPLEFIEFEEYKQDKDLREIVGGVLKGAGAALEWIGEGHQRALLEAETATLVRKTKQANDKLFVAAAAKNFSKPYGPLDEQLIALAEEELAERVAALEKGRDFLFSKAFALVTDAVVQSIKIEDYHFKWYMRYLRANLRIYEANVRLAATAYESLVQVYQRIDQIVAQQVQAYNQYLRAVSTENTAQQSKLKYTEAEIEKFRAEVAMFAADIRLREASVQVQRADVQQQLLPIEVYEATLRGTIANLGIVEQNIRAYGQAVDAYSRYSQWFDSALGAYEASIDASASKIGVNQSKFDAYRQLWGAESDRISAYQQYVSASTSAMDSEVGNFRAAANAQRQYLSDVMSALSSTQQAVGAYASAAGAGAGAAGAYNIAQVSYTNASNDISVADGTRGMIADAEKSDMAVQFARLDVAREAAKVTSAASLSQSADAIFSKQLAARGSASHRVSGRDSGDLRGSFQDRKVFSKSCNYIERKATM